MILLVNPRSAQHSHRVPLSVLTVAAGLEGRYSYEVVDENLEADPDKVIEKRIRQLGVRYLGLTVMPGPQLVRAIRLSRIMKSLFPKLVVIWGGTFPSIHTDVVLESGHVDIAVLGDGETILPDIVEALEHDAPLDSVRGIAFRRNGSMVQTKLREWGHPNDIPPLPYHRVNVQQYLQRTYLGNRTSAYHSSKGCPFKCGFCSVVSIFQGRWFAQSAERVADEVFHVKKEFGVDSIEFFDDNFFTLEQRVGEFSERIKDAGLAWWGEGRSDTLFHYADTTLRKMRDAGCRMIYTGAETSSAEKLKLMNKGGTQSAETIIEFARRIKEFDIVPEFSFIFGSPSDDIDDDIDRDIQFIKQIKKVNPRSEIIFYVYAPVLLPGASLFEEATRHGFAYPRTLEEWTQPQWLHFDLRKRPMLPWIKPKHIRKIRNFERVLNAYYPSISDLRLTEPKRRFMRFLSSWRYENDFHAAPYEIRLFLTKVFKYRQPEIEGAPQYPPHGLLERISVS